MRKIYLWYIISILVILNLITLYFLIISRNADALANGQNTYQYISPRIAWIDVDDFLQKQKSMTVSYTDLKQQLLLQIEEMNVSGNYGIYFEDLTTGAWVGINETETFYPFSLLKVPVLVAVLKKVQDENLTLEDRVTIKPEYLDSHSGTLYLKGAGYSPTIEELLDYLIIESDNTAVLTLSNSVLSEDDIYYADIAMGLVSPTTSNTQPVLSAKEYSNIFRSLYYSTYLRRDFSELALILMMNTSYDTQLPAGIPPEVKMSHKIGYYIEQGYYHDCGIVYATPNPYLICVMTSNFTRAEADRFISTISKTVYDYAS
jgi:beta-lactamase class A